MKVSESDKNFILPLRSNNFAQSARSPLSAVDGLGLKKIIFNGPVAQFSQ